MTQVGQFSADRVDVRDQWVSSHLIYKEQSGGPRLCQDVQRLVRLQTRVDSDERQPGQGRGVFEQHPLRQVVGPYRDVFTGREVLQKITGAALGVLEQLGIGPLPPVSCR